MATKTSKSRETERTVRIVYLIVSQKTGRAVDAYVTRSDARASLAPGGKHEQAEYRVVRCEAVETRRTKGGA